MLIDLSQEILGSQIQIKIVTEQEAAARETVAAAFAECQRIEAAFSRFQQTSELVQLNHNLNEWQQVSPELFNLISTGEMIREESNGAFNLTVHNILTGWGYDENYSLQEATPGQLGQIELRPDSHEVHITAPIDLGGLGKGYALDQMVKICQHFPNLLINAGGDIYAQGQDETGEPWLIYFEHPLDPQMVIGQARVSNLYLACSNPNRRQWRDRHHLVNPETKQPASEMLSVYIQTPLSGTTADAWATALFAMGYEHASQNQWPVETMLISKEGNIKTSANYQIELFQS